MKTIEEELIQACKEYTAALDSGNGEARDTASDIWNKRIDTYNKVMCDPQIPQSVKEEMIENIKPHMEILIGSLQKWRMKRRIN